MSSQSPMYMEYVDDADADEAPVRRRGWRILGWVSIALSVLMVGTSLTAYAFYRKFNGNITHEDTDALIGTNRPKKLNSALNILLLGSDTRDGANAKYGRSLKGEPPRSDTMILLHLSPGGSQAMGISFPRDLMVPIPSCTRKDGTRTPASSVAMINESFTRGGATCTIKTIEGITDVKIDHFLQVDFTGFKNITTAVGGVEVCLPKAVNDPQSKLKLPKGRQTIKGEQALAYVRNRHGLGDGSDLDRIKRQQQFMGSLAKKSLSAGTLTNPNRLLSLLNAGTKSLTTDKGLSVSTMLKIAQGMQGLTAGKLRFVTVPYGAYAPDPNRVALRQPDAANFFSLIRNDKTVPEDDTKPTTKKTTVPASQIRVKVYNASGVQGQASRVASQLETMGYQVLGTGNLTARNTSQVLYGTGADQQAASLATVLSGSPTPAATTKVSPGTVALVVGADWTATSIKQTKKTGIPRQQGEIRATDNICKEA